jgi:hypothetical protein
MVKNCLGTRGSSNLENDSDDNSYRDCMKTLSVNGGRAVVAQV